MGTTLATQPTVTTPREPHWQLIARLHYGIVNILLGEEGLRQGLADSL